MAKQGTQCGVKVPVSTARVEATLRKKRRPVSATSGDTTLRKNAPAKELNMLSDGRHQQHAVAECISKEFIFMALTSTTTSEARRSSSILSSCC
ncbi:unnamed protein product [Polarella glacialis]|uniref:Uncharacterized protein n=1 Tax=Polarella glacialis TaxID=89957 RepID=A0A813DUS1_POLGL|nr:unnamed protein product [Polarella glacialis]CAE8626800.1 unnamed protein product [Polarella glacialis]